MVKGDTEKHYHVNYLSLCSCNERRSGANRQETYKIADTLIAVAETYNWLRKLQKTTGISSYHLYIVVINEGPGLSNDARGIQKGGIIDARQQTHELSCRRNTSLAKKDTGIRG